MTAAAALHAEITGWLSNKSKLDFLPVHSQHISERKEGSGAISSSVQSFCDEFVKDDQNDTWWLKGVCGLPAPTKIEDSS
jgi:hypothetical protein